MMQTNLDRMAKILNKWGWQLYAAHIMSVLIGMIVVLSLCEGYVDGEGEVS